MARFFPESGLGYNRLSWGSKANASQQWSKLGGGGADDTLEASRQKRNNREVKRERRSKPWFRSGAGAL